MASRKSWLIGLSFVLSALILAFLLSKVSTAQLTDAVSHAKREWLLAALVVSLFAMLLRAWRLHVLVTQSQLPSHKPLAFSFTFLAQMAGMAASNFSPGRALEAAKVIPLKKAGVPYAQGALAVVWERLFDLFALVLLSFLVFARLGADSQGVLAGFGVLLALFAWLLLTRASELVALFANFPMMGFLKTVKLHAFERKRLAASFLLTVLAWLADALVFYLVFLSLGLSFDGVLVIGAFGVSVLIGAITLLPAGLGSTEAAMAFVLAGGASGLSNPSLLAALFVARAFSLGLSTLAGAVSVPLLAKRMEK